MSRRRGELQLPVSRVKTIMKSSPDVEAVGPEPLLLVTKVTELFVADLARRAFDHGNASSLDYKDLAALVKADDTLDFLREIMPCKITVRQFKELIARKNEEGDDDDDSDSEESDSGEEEEDEEEDGEEEEGDEEGESEEDGKNAVTNGK